jgi:hypothetical protein
MRFGRPGSAHRSGGFCEVSCGFAERAGKGEGAGSHLNSARRVCDACLGNEGGRPLTQREHFGCCGLLGLKRLVVPALATREAAGVGGKR